MSFPIHVVAAHALVTSAFYTVSKFKINFGGGHGHGGGHPGHPPLENGVAYPSLEENLTFWMFLEQKKGKRA